MNTISQFDLFNNIDPYVLFMFYVPKILIATLCGGMVGLEREMKHKVAGIKTNIMICVGSTLFAATSFLLNSFFEGDPTRIAAQIVSGIGFLGAGAIFRSDEKIRGLTSAALIWILAAIGIMIAAGGYVISIVATIGLVVLTVISSMVESKLYAIQKKRTTRKKKTRARVQTKKTTN